MTTEQFFCLAATIWMAPHASKKYSIFASCIFLILAAFTGLEWI
jgi:hypothetical protein